MSMVSEIRRLKEQRCRLRAALDRVWMILDSDELRGSVQMADVHGFPYRGGLFTKADYEAAITDVTPMSKP